MNQYLVTRTDKPDWSRIPAVSLQHTGWLSPCPVSASAQLCHNGEALFVRMAAKEADIRAELTSPLDQVCCDSCLEFFFAPLEKDGRYFNFEFNPLGNFYIGFGRERDTRVRLLPADTAQFAICPRYTEEGWEITYRIPGSFIRMFAEDFRFTGHAACNFYKCGEDTKVPHYLSWTPLHCDQPDYHRRQDFGLLTFE